MPLFRINITVVLVVLVIAFGASGIYLFSQNRILQSKLNTQGEVVHFEFLNPAKILNINRHFIIDFSDLRKRFESIVGKHPQKTYVYFMYLGNGGWVGINEREKFVAASLVKVPLAMTFFKAVEQGKITLTQQYTLTEADLDEGFGDLYRVGVGKTFSAEDLIRIMLSKSDNTAMHAITTLLARIGITDPFSDVYAELGWEILPPIIGNEIIPANIYAEISVKVLSNMLLALYNATYINTEHSQQVLRNLADTPFHDSLPAGVTSETIVAHKIGVSVNDNTFSDCGIIYVPGRPYLLCVGSKGVDQQKANAFMAEVSEAAFGFITEN
jgi:beta-lactamase class A